MVVDWLEQQGILVTEAEGKVKFAFQNACYSVEKDSLEKLDVHTSISMYEEISAALGLNS